MKVTSIRSPWSNGATPVAQKLEPPTTEDLSTARRTRPLAIWLAALGVGLAVAGAAAHVVLTAPVCDGQPHVVCVSPQTGTWSTQAWRRVRGFFNTPAAIENIVSDRSQVFDPPAGVAPPRPLMQDGRLRVVTWNLHGEANPNATGSHPQWDEMVARMRADRAEVYLLQEVSPWKAQALANQMGMRAFLANTLPSQSDVMLIHPHLEVTDHRKAMVRHAVGDRMEAMRAYVREPRAVQWVRVKLPDGRPLMIWNTHLTAAHPDDPERVAEAMRLLKFITIPDEASVGGGDLNAGPGSAVWQAFAASGYRLSGSGLDWIATRHAHGEGEADTQWFRGRQGLPLSDHPRVMWAIASSQPTSRANAVSE